MPRKERNINSNYGKSKGRHKWNPKYINITPDDPSHEGLGGCIVGIIILVILIVIIFLFTGEAGLINYLQQ